MKKCIQCNINPAKVLRARNQKPFCLECFFAIFEQEIHYTIRNYVKQGDRIAVGVSGGKDSTVLAYVLNKLNNQYNYGIQLFLLAIDEGITGYRDDSLKTLELTQQLLNLPLRILSFQDLFNVTMDQVVQKIGLGNNCTYCGVMRRQGLEKGAQMLNCNIIATGHNADDMAETVFLNFLRGDYFRLETSVSVLTGLEAQQGGLPRLKPLKYCYEKEIVLYAHHLKLPYFATECTYAPGSYRGQARFLIKQLERIKPDVILDIIHSAEGIAQGIRQNQMASRTKMVCNKCGYLSSREICQACNLLSSLFLEKQEKQDTKTENESQINPQENEQQSQPLEESKQEIVEPSKESEQLQEGQNK